MTQISAAQTAHQRAKAGNVETAIIGLKVLIGLPNATLNLGSVAVGMV